MKITTYFWKMYAKLWDLRPRMHLPKYTDYPIAYCDIRDSYEYPPTMKVLYEWDEKGHHWVVFSR